MIVALPGDYGKPRPAVVVQADLFAGAASVTIVPVTTTVVDAPLFRLTLDPTPANGLRAVSQLMIDKVTTVARSRVRRVAGRLDADLMLRVNRALALWLGLAA